MFLKENDDLYDKIDYKKKMSTFGFKNEKEKPQENGIEDEFLLDEDDEEEKELELSLTKYSKTKKDVDLLRRPRLFVLPNIEKLKEMIRESLSQIFLGKTPVSPTSYS